MQNVLNKTDSSLRTTPNSVQLSSEGSTVRSKPKTVISSAVFQVGIATVPVFFSYLAIFLEATNIDLIRWLILSLFLSSIILLFINFRMGISTGILSGFVFVAGFLLWYAYPAFMGLVFSQSLLESEVYHFAGNDSILLAIFYLALFQLTVIATINLKIKTPQRSTRTWNLNLSVPILVFLCLTGTAFAFMRYTSADSLSEIVNGIFASRAVEKSWVETSNLGDESSPLNFLTLSTMIACAALFWLFVLDKKQSARLRLFCSSFALLLTTIIFFDQGTRSLIALVILPVLTLGFISAWRRLGIKSIGIAVVIGFFLLGIFQFQLLYRTEYTRANISESLFQDWTTLGGTIDYFKETVYSVKLVPELHDYFYESAFVQFAVSPIPRFLWTEKPASELVRIYSLWRWNRDIYVYAGNMLPGIVGQYYMSWGVFGILLIGIIYGVLIRFINAWLARPEIRESLYLQGLGAMFLIWLFISFRLFSHVFLYPVLIAGFFVFLSIKIKPKPLRA